MLSKPGCFSLLPWWSFCSVSPTERQWSCAPWICLIASGNRRENKLPCREPAQNGGTHQPILRADKSSFKCRRGFMLNPAQRWFFSLRTLCTVQNCLWLLESLKELHQAVKSRIWLPANCSAVLWDKRCLRKGSSDNYPQKSHLGVSWGGAQSHTHTERGRKGPWRGVSWGPNTDPHILELQMEGGTGSEKQSWFEVQVMKSGRLPFKDRIMG